MVDDEFNSHGMTLAKIAQSLTAMIDGFWVGYLICADRHTPEDAVKACFAFLSSFFPEFEESDWSLICSQDFQADKKNPLATTFKHLVRR